MTSPAGETPGEQRWSGRIVALLGISLVALNLRTAVTSISPLLNDVDADIGLGSTGMGMLGMVPTAMFALWGILTPFVLRRMTLEWLTVLAMVAAGSGQVMRAFAVEPLLMGAGSLIALSGMGIGNIVAPPLVKKYFPDMVPTVSVIYITILQAGTMLPAMLAVPVAEETGWRVSIGWWASFAVIAIIPWLIEISRGSTPRVPGRGSATAAAAAVPATATGIKPWRSPVGITLAIFFGTNSLCTYAFFTWLPAVVEEVGMSQAQGGLALAVFSGVGVVASIVVPWVAGRLDDPYIVVIVSVAAYLVGFAGLLWAFDTAPWLWILMLGIGPSTFPLVLTLINLRTRTADGSAALSGFSQGVGYTTASLGPLVFGELLARFSLEAAVLFLVIVLAVMTVVARVPCRPRMLEDTLR